MKTRLYLILSCLLALVAGAAPYANFSTNVSGLKLTGWTTTTNPVTARAALGIVTGGDSLWTNNAFGTVSLVDRTTNNDFNIDSDGTIHGQADGWSINSAHGVFGGLTLQDQAITPANGLWELPNSGTIFATAFTTDTNRVLTVILPTNTPADGQVLTASGTGGATAWAGLSGSASNLTDVPWSWREQAEDLDHNWGIDPEIPPMSYSFTISGSPSNEINGTYYYIGTVVGDGDVHRWTNYVTTARMEKDPNGDATIHCTVEGTDYTYYYSIDAGVSKDFNNATWELGINGYGTITVSSTGAGIAYGDQSYTNNQSLLWASNGVWLVSYITNAGYAAPSVKSFPSPMQPSRFGQTTTNAALLTTGILANARLDPNLVASNVTITGSSVIYTPITIHPTNSDSAGDWELGQPVGAYDRITLSLVGSNKYITVVSDGSLYADGTLSGDIISAQTGFTGIGTNITSLNASALTIGTVDNARLAGNVLTNGHSAAVTVSNGLTVFFGNQSTNMLKFDGNGLTISNSSPLANQVLLKIQTSDDASRFQVDEDGDVNADGIITAGNYFSGALRGSVFCSVGADVGFDRVSSGVAKIINSGGVGLGSLMASNIYTEKAIYATNGLVLPGTNAVIQFMASSNTNGPAMAANLAYIFAGSNGTAASIYTMDGSGTIKMISEHALPGDAPDSIADDDDPFPNVSKDANYYLGKIRWVNRSRAARQQELLTKITLNSMANWMFLQGKTSAQWSNSAAYGKYTNSLMKLDELAETSRQLVVNETFEEYRLRTGVSLQQVSWTEVQTRLSNDVFTAYSSALEDYEAAVAAGDTNAVAPGPYVPRVPESVPTWLYNRGVR